MNCMLNVKDQKVEPDTHWGKERTRTVWTKGRQTRSFTNNLVRKKPKLHGSHQLLLHKGGQPPKGWIRKITVAENKGRAHKHLNQLDTRCGWVCYENVGLNQGQPSHFTNRFILFIIGVTLDSIEGLGKKKQNTNTASALACRSVKELSSSHGHQQLLPS